MVTLGRFGAADVVKEGRGVEEDACAGHAERAVETGGGEAVEELEGETSNLARMSGVGIEA